MNAKLLSISISRSIKGVPVANLDAIKGEALAYAQDVGISSSATAAKRQSWQYTAEAAIAIQGDQVFDTNDKRKAALEAHRAKVVTELRSAAVAEMAKAQGWDRDHVAKGKDSDGNKHTSLKSLMVQAQNRVKNYYGRITAAWDAGLFIESEAMAKGAGLKVEAANALSRRTAEAIAGKTEPTPGDVVVRAFGQLSGDVGEAVEDLKYKESAESLSRFSEAVKLVVLRAVHGQLSIEDVNTLSELLVSAGADKAPTDEPLDTESADKVIGAAPVQPQAVAA